MASYEKEMIPLEAVYYANEGIPEQFPVKEELVDVKFPSCPRRRVVIIAGVIAGLIVVIVVASLIGKYVTAYLSDANNKSDKGSKDKGIGEPEGSIASSIPLPSERPGEYLSDSDCQRTIQIFITT
ncbi:hypothetical protein ACROYT_G031643 [Oculina patagonica]